MRKKRILCACECSQALTSCFLDIGKDCYSCDLSPVLPGALYPERHFQCDVFDIIDDFDSVFAFPPCTHLSFANGAHLKEKIKDGRIAGALDFFKRLYEKKNVLMLENPLGVIPGMLGLSYSQIVSPEMFGSEKKKRTCLWLKGLPVLLPTSSKPGKSFIQSLSSYDFRRSILDPYLAKAMASQWGDYV